MTLTDAPMPAPEPFSYDAIAATYAARVDAAPYNALYERPAMLARLPPVAGRRVLDAGCGSGWYAERLLARGAAVTAVDASPAMAAFTRERVGGRADVRVADRGAPLAFPDAAFDLVVSALVLHYLRDWGPALGEVRRVLAPGGALLFSTHHPATEAARLAEGGRHGAPSSAVDHFGVEPVEEVWSWLGPVRFWRRPLTAVVDALADAGFLVERLVEPRPTAAFRDAKPEVYGRLLRRPEFFLVRARAG